MDRKSADRIIVKSNARMDIVIDWFFEKEKWLSEQEFMFPIEQGVVELQEEGLEFTFDKKSDKEVHIAVYALEHPELPAMFTFDFYPNTKGLEIDHLNIGGNISQKKKKAMGLILLNDRTPYNISLKYHSLMQFMTYYRPLVSVTEVGRRTKHEAKQIRRSRDRPLPLIRKQYVIENIDVKDIYEIGEKRHYSKPEHEVNVRGFIRHYKSGKTAWIKPHTRYKGQDKKRKEYQL